MITRARGLWKFCLRKPQRQSIILGWIWSALFNQTTKAWSVLAKPRQERVLFIHKLNFFSVNKIITKSILATVNYETRHSHRHARYKYGIRQVIIRITIISSLFHNRINWLASLLQICVGILVTAYHFHGASHIGVLTVRIFTLKSCSTHYHWWPIYWRMSFTD